jgi:hypothetical protein
MRRGLPRLIGILPILPLLACSACAPDGESSESDRVATASDAMSDLGTTVPAPDTLQPPPAHEGGPLHEASVTVSRDGSPADGSPVDAGPAIRSDAGSTDAILVNFDDAGHQMVRRDANGNALDAHDGGLALFDGVYYLYGTTYACGFAWQKAGTPFCGFRSYASTDLTSWVDRGLLFDATTPTWQSRCNGSTYGCYRPHVIYNASTKRYVLWINSYDNPSGFHAFQSSTPSGPFIEAPFPVVAVNASVPLSQIHNGDENLFVDLDGKGYLVYTDWVAGGDILVEELDASHLTGTGRFVRLGLRSTEAPAMFRRADLYYITYSDPNCGYCGGTGTSYRTSSSPLGPWQTGKKVSSDSCGGQPSHVTVFPGTGGDSLFLYQSDLWQNGAPNETKANLFWGLLTFGTNGTVDPIVCAKSIRIPVVAGTH